MTSADRRRLYDTYAQSRNHPAASITTNTATAKNRPTQFVFFSLFCSLLSFFFKSVCSMFYLYETGTHFMIRRLHKSGDQQTQTSNKLLQFTVVYGSWEWNDVTDVAHTGQIHHASLESKSESRMSCRTVLTKIKIELVIFFLQSQLVHAGK